MVKFEGLLHADVTNSDKKSSFPSCLLEKQLFIALETAVLSRKSLSSLQTSS